MKVNEGRLDRIIRFVLAIVLAVLYFTGIAEGGLGIVVLIAAVMMLVTAITGFCGLYALLGITTCPVKKES